MNTLFWAGKFTLVLIVPLLIAIAPWALCLFLTQRQSIKQSVGLAALSAIVSGLTGLVTPFLAYWICATAMSIDLPPTGPKCDTGAAFFLAIGYIFTAITALTGTVFTTQLFIAQRRLSSY